MGLRCLLGHDYGEVELEREREEDGDEMVLTITEVRTCERCGDRRTVSENKEITSIRSLEEVGFGDGADTPSADDEAAASGAEGDSTTGAADVGAAATTTGAPGGTGATESTHPNVDGAVPAAGDTDDDGVIIADEAGERQPGEWPAPERPAARAQARAEEDAGAGADDVSEPAAASDDGPSAGEGPSTATPPADERDDVEILGDDGGAEPVDGAGADAGPAGTATADQAGPDDATQAELSGRDGEPSLSSSDEDGASDAGGEKTASDTEVSEWPTHEGQDEGYDAEVGGSDAGISFSGSSLTPEVEVDDDEADVGGDLEGDVTTAGADFEDDETAAGTDFEDDETAAGPGGVPVAPGGQDDAAASARTTGSETEAAPDDGEVLGGDQESGNRRARGPAGVGTNIAREGSPSGQSGAGSADTEYYCPNCEMTSASTGSSMRAGDICPECRKGYVTERER